MNSSVVRKAIVTLIQGAAAVVTAYLTVDAGWGMEYALAVGSLVAAALSVAYNMVRDYLRVKQGLVLPEIPEGFDSFSTESEFPADGQATEVE